MTKSEFYKTSATYIKSCTDSDKVVKVKSLVNEVMTKKKDASTALLEYNEIISSGTTLNETANPMISKIANKPLGKSITKYYKEGLDDTSTAKMASSIVTHCIIESQLNESYSLHSEGVSKLLDTIKGYADTGSVDRTLLNNSLELLGLHQEVTNLA